MPGDGVGGATGVGSLAVEFAGALSATVTFSSPGMDANYEVILEDFIQRSQFVVVVMRKFFSVMNDDIAY